MYGLLTKCEVKMTGYYPAEAGATTAAKIVNLVKEKALEDLFKLASAVVEEVFSLL